MSDPGTGTDPGTDTDLGKPQEAAVDAALARLSLKDKVAILSGQDFWSLPALPQVGLDSVVMSDGPVGVRGTTWGTQTAITLPSPTALAASWDPELARRAGRVLGQEARRLGVHVLLAPTVNLHRSPLGGRHFECYSEDPLLTAAIGAGYVRGVQDHGVAATVKHFVANDAETERFTVSVQAAERTLRELYLAPFEQIIAAARPWAVMSAYNSVGGQTMTEHAGLQHGVLKGEWGFDGAVISDWTAARDTVGAALGGTDIAMPGGFSPWGEQLLAAVADGRVPAGVIDAQARRVLLLAARTGALDGAPPSVPPAARPADLDGAAVAREIAARSVVLAANPAAVLPLDAARLGSVAVIGQLARDARILGGGSAQSYPPHAVSPLQGLQAALGEQARVSFAAGADLAGPRLAPATAPAWQNLTATFRDAAGKDLHASPLATGAGRWPELPAGAEDAVSVQIAGQLTAGDSGGHRIAVRGHGQLVLAAGGQVLFDGQVERGAEHRVALELAAGSAASVTLTGQVVAAGGEEGGDGHGGASLTLGYAPPAAGPDEMLAEAAGLAAASDVAVVVVGTTEQVESEGFDRTSLALPGRQDDLVRAVIAASPATVVVVNAGSPVELPWAGDAAAVLLTWFGGQEAGHALADVLLGRAEPGGRLPTSWPARQGDCPVLTTTPSAGVLAYDEGVFIGYRAYERAGVTPRYPFGHGLGYTSWDYEQITAGAEEVTVTVRNTGTRPGREVIQVYAGPADPADPAAAALAGGRPRRWLAGFASVTAGPGETVTATIPLPERTFQSWAGDPGGWQTMPGEYVIEAARSRADVRATTVVTVGPR